MDCFDCKRKPTSNLIEFSLSCVIFFENSKRQPCDSFNYLKTSAYKLHYFETATGLKFVLLTEPGAGDMREALKTIYNLYIQYVAKNPLYKINERIECELFIHHLQKYFHQLQQL
jgi:hypothetical protein